MAADFVFGFVVGACVGAIAYGAELLALWLARLALPSVAVDLNIMSAPLFREVLTLCFLLAIISSAAFPRLLATFAVEKSSLVTVSSGDIVTMLAALTIAGFMIAAPVFAATLLVVLIAVIVQRLKLMSDGIVPMAQSAFLVLVVSVVLLPFSRELAVGIHAFMDLAAVRVLIK